MPENFQPLNSKHLNGTTGSRSGASPGRFLVPVAGGALGLYLVISSRALPPGLGSLPGPGFFPFILGLLILTFAAMIAWEARANSQYAPPVAVTPWASWGLPAIAVVLIAAWILSWEWVPFLIRTPLLVIALMRLAGSSWRAALLAAVAFTAFLFAVFQLGLRVDLG